LLWISAPLAQEHCCPFTGVAVILGKDASHPPHCEETGHEAVLPLFLPLVLVVVPVPLLGLLQAMQIQDCNLSWCLSVSCLGF
jgi:hypothetical protein